MRAWTVAVGPRAGDAAGEAVARLRAAGVDTADLRVDSRAALTAGVAEAAAAGRGILVVGGDGTVNAAVEGVIDAPDPRVSLLPRGTGSDFARMFAFNSDIGPAVRRTLGDDTYPVDVGVIEGAWGRRVVVNEVQAGIGAATAAFAERLPVRWGARKYEIAFWAALPSFRPGSAVLHTVRGERALQRGVVVVAANGEFFGGGMRIAPRASVIDGAFDLILIDTHRAKALTLFPRMKRGLHLSDKVVRRIVTPWFRLETQRPWPVEVDGDHLGDTPLEGRIQPAAFRLHV